MGLLKKLFTNCACPQGRMGRAMLKFMNLCHAPLTNWGLKLVDIQDGWTMLDDAGFIQTEILRMKPSNATIIGVKPFKRA